MKTVLFSRNKSKKLKKSNKLNKLKKFNKLGKLNIGDTKFIPLLFFAASIFYCELVMRIHCGIQFFGKGLLYIFLFSLAFGCFFGLISVLGKYRWNRWSSLVIAVVGTVTYGTQAVYYTIFSEYVTLFSLTNAGMVLTSFWKDAVIGIWHTLPTLLFLFVPIALYFIFGRKYIPKSRIDFKRLICALAAAVAVYSVGVTAVVSSTEGIMSDRYVYSEIFNTKLSVPRFGILTTIKLDFRHVLFGKLEEPKLLPSEAPETPPVQETPKPSAPLPEVLPEDASKETEDAEPVVYGDNVMEIDFDKLIAGESSDAVRELHEYFSTAEPTKKNRYTGMFRDYNLIWIVAESFSTYALDADHTPTLTKMANEGFVFNNFYNPVWGVSTSDGEYVTTTGLVPKTGVWSYYWSGFNYMPFGFGNMFSKLGYSARAYHNNEYTYYDRQISYPNMGYDYKGVGNGLEISDLWPESDVEMIDKTVGEYVNDPNFMVYYLTVSGHLNYNFYGNAMCVKHEAEVADLPYSDAARAYIAGQMEFDQSVELLIKKLDVAGKLDNTVIVISGDHYPYGLEVSEMEELYGGELDTDFEMYKSTLIIWNPNIERVEVDKICSSLDVMPTLANLFGLEYDSRLVIGKDILSNSEGLVMFSDHSYIAPGGRYSANWDEFYPAEGYENSADYAREMLEKVNKLFRYSEMILDYDYYAKVFNYTGAD